MKKGSLKPLWITLIVIASLVLLAIIFGVLNALIGGGKWFSGWSDYQYDETGFSVGDGTIYEVGITALDVDWMNGNVEVVLSEDDAFFSLSESAGEELASAEQLRWKVEDGILTVKFRKSVKLTVFGMTEKKLILRVPAKYAEKVSDIRVHSSSASVLLKGISAQKTEIVTASGNISVVDCHTQQLEFRTVSGDTEIRNTVPAVFSFRSTSGSLNYTGDCPAQLTAVTTSGDLRFVLPPDASFAMEYGNTSGRLFSDFVLSERDGKKISGAGDADFSIRTSSGNVTLSGSGS